MPMPMPSLPPLSPPLTLRRDFLIASALVALLRPEGVQAQAAEFDEVAVRLAIAETASLMKEGLSACREQGWMKGVGLFTQALQRVEARGPGAWPVRVRVLAPLGMCLRRLGRAEDAIPRLQKALLLRDRLSRLSDPRMAALNYQLDVNPSKGLESVEQGRQAMGAVRDPAMAAVKPPELLLNELKIEIYCPALSLCLALVDVGRPQDIAAVAKRELARVPAPGTPGYAEVETRTLAEYQFFHLARVAAGVGVTGTGSALLLRAQAMNWDRCVGSGTWGPSVDHHVALFRIRRAQIALHIDMSLARTTLPEAVRAVVARIVESKGLAVRHAERMRWLLATSTESRLREAEKEWQALEDRTPLQPGSGGVSGVLVEQRLREMMLLRGVVHDLRRLGLGQVFVPGEQVLKALSRLAGSTVFIGFFIWRPVLAAAAQPGSTPEERYLRYVVHGERTEIRDLGPKAPVDQLIWEWRQALQGRASAPAEEAAGAALARLLLADLPAAAQSSREWVLDPDGALHLLPFDALSAGARGGRLIDHHLIRFCSSLAAVAMPMPAAAMGPAQVLADPAYGPQTSITALPETRREARLVAAALRRHGIAVETHLGPGANAAALAFAVPPAYLHVAVHGVMLPDADETDVGARGEQQIFRPGRSAALLLGNGSAVERITALDLQRVRLQGTRLVVLSACDSGNGRIEPGEGVASLRRAVETAGAQASIRSLWPVPSEGTVALMGALYDALADGLTPAEALLRAKQQARHAGLPASCWAGFVAAGRPA